MKKGILKYCSLCGNKLRTKNIEGCERYICSNTECSHVYWNNPVPVVAALVEFHEKYIIARNTKWPKGIFSVITGYLEQNESPEDAVLRETSEELGLEGKIKRHIGNYIFKEKNQLILGYEVLAKGFITTNDEIAEIKQLTATELLNYDFTPLYITESIIYDWKNN